MFQIYISTCFYFFGFRKTLLYEKELWMNGGIMGLGPARNKNFAGDHKFW